MKFESVWLDSVDMPAFPPLAQDIEVDVAVVGGGLVGLTASLLAQRGGARVAVLEAARIGAGTTGHTTGKVTSQHGLIYADLIERHGEAAAQIYAEANQGGVEQVARLVEEFGIDCDLTRGVAYAYTQIAEQRHEVEEEVRAAQRLGLPASLTDETDLPFDVQAAVAFAEQLHFHPGRYLAGLVRALTRAEGMVFEQTRVTELDEQSDHTIRVTTSSGTVRAGQVVVATLLPIGRIGGYFAKTRPMRSYALAVRLRGPAPTSMSISIDSPSRSTRPWLPGQNGMIVVGNGHETGAEQDTEAMYADLEDWTRTTFAVEALDYRWSAQDYTTPDRVPYVWHSPMTENVLVATGFAKWGLSNGTAAAMILADLVAGRDNPWLPVFDATRIGDAKAVGRLIKDNLKVGTELLGGHLARPGSSDRDLAPGEGGLVEAAGETVAAYRDPTGHLHTVTPNCTHLGCRLGWNAAETSWDCHCHGSRFDCDGSVLNGPAVKPLKPIDARDA
jgi:glycine/D-amino acid oxidase-like deaminating enzyme/nitrite reductase/ring-hydroxylating ferredoxin subunit